MKKAIKKSVEVILTIIACVSFFLMFGESTDGSVLWNLGWIAALAVSATLLGKMGAFDKKEERA